MGRKLNYFFSRLKYFQFLSKISLNTTITSLRVKEDNFKKLRNFCEINNYHSEKFISDPQLEKLFNNFYFKYKNSFLKKQFIIHTLPRAISPGGFSAFFNFYSALVFFGVNVKLVTDGKNLEYVIDKDCDEIILLSSDNDLCLNDLPDYFELNKIHSNISLGLVAAPNSDLVSGYQRIKSAERLNVKFYFSYWNKEYTDNSKLFEHHIKSEIPFLNVELATDCFIIYPIESQKKIYDYVFLASSNEDKRERYYSYLTDIFSKYYGLINGPGWPFSRYVIDKIYHNYIYSLTKVGINLHIQESINNPTELNERTYTLACAGVPQIIDNAKLIHTNFPEGSFFVADNPKEYGELFEFVLKNPELGQKYAKKARIATLNNHTIFHRIDELLTNLIKYKIINN